MSESYGPFVNYAKGEFNSWILPYAELAADVLFSSVAMTGLNTGLMPRKDSKFSSDLKARY